MEQLPNLGDEFLTSSSSLTFRNACRLTEPEAGDLFAHADALYAELNVSHSTTEADGASAERSRAPFGLQPLLQKILR